MLNVTVELPAGHLSK